MKLVSVTNEQFDMILRMINSDIDRLVEMISSKDFDENDMRDMSAEIVRLENLKTMLEF